MREAERFGISITLLANAAQYVNALTTYMSIMKDQKDGLQEKQTLT